MLRAPNTTTEGAVKKAKVKGGTMRVRAYPILETAIEEGVAYGWRRAHKHTDTPDEDAICSEIYSGVMNSICEYFEFDDEDEL